jgi:hypothetical protein
MSNFSKQMDELEPQLAGAEFGMKWDQDREVFKNTELIPITGAAIIARLYRSTDRAFAHADRVLADQAKNDSVTDYQARRRLYEDNGLASL